ncbi:hypothetical protein HID58_073412, partial [Brassica napus]
KSPKTKTKQQSPTSKSPKQWTNQKTQQLKHGLRPTSPSRTNRGKHAETCVEFSERKRHVSTSNNKRKHVSRNQAPPPNMTEQPRETPDHVGIRTTTRNSTRTLTRATESISNDCIGRLLESVSSSERFGEFNRNRKRNQNRDLIQDQAHAHHKLRARTTRNKGRLHAVEKTTVYQSRNSYAVEGATATLNLSKQREKREKARFFKFLLLTRRTKLNRDKVQPETKAKA